MIDKDTPAKKLLNWYDRHARVLPWRIGPGDRAAGHRSDPYRVWLSEIMLQQTTVVVVKGYFERFVARWPTVGDLAAAPDGEVMAEWAGLGYYARARNLLKCARIVAQDFGGVFPDTEKGLLDLPGVGPYTAAAIAAIAFDRPAVVVDGNVERVVARFAAITGALPGSKGQIHEAAGHLSPHIRPGDYAQAMMDLGATVCTPRSPDCGRCPWQEGCLGRAAGIAETLPRKAPRKPKPLRRGVVFVLRGPAGEWGLERRPENGLLGGTEGFPGSAWREDPDMPEPPVMTDWEEAGEIRHTFTHFHLRLDVRIARNVPRTSWPNSLRVVPKEAFDPATLPGVMRKVAAAADTASAGSSPA